MIRYYDVGQLTTAELERAKRELQANLGLINPDSPAHLPIQAHMQAIDTELSRRADGQQASEAQRHDNERPPRPATLPALPGGRGRNTQKPPARAGLDTARAGPDTAINIRINPGRP
jgi:hypothetical protein